MDKNEKKSLESDHESVEKSFRTDGLKQRLIGAIVLVSLAVIFLPMIFDQPHQEKKNIVIPIPERPPEKLVTFETPKPPELKETGAKEKSLELIHSSNQSQSRPIAAKATIETQTETVNTTVDKSPGASTLTAPEDEQSEDAEPDVVEATAVPAKADAVVEELPRSLEQAWVVQLGTFGNKENALKLRDKARAQGYSTHTTPLQRDGKTLTRVFSGPFINKDDAEKVKTLLDKKFSVKSIVIQFSE